MAFHFHFFQLFSSFQAFDHQEEKQKALPACGPSVLQGTLDGTPKLGSVSINHNQIWMFFQPRDQWKYDYIYIHVYNR